MSKRASPHTLEQLAEALCIFAKYEINAAPDEFTTRESLWGTVDGDVCIDIDPIMVFEKDKARLKELGWLPDEYQTFFFNTHLAYVSDDD